MGTPPAALPGSFRDGRYEMVELLGVGTQKRVYRAHDRSLDRDVAIAVIEPSGLDTTQLARVSREARATGRLGNHESIVTIHDIWYEGDQPYIVTEYMPGGDLAAMLEALPDHRLAWPRATEIAEGVCRALDHAHRLGVIHRDVKPANVWFDARGAPKLGDFGLALVGDLVRLSTQGTVVGTFAYLAPEQAFGEAATPATDLYSLGVMLYEMVTGRLPFAGEEANSLLYQHAHVTPIAPSILHSEIPPALDALVLELMAKRPEDRPQEGAGVADRLRDLRAAAKHGLAAEPTIDAPRSFSQSGFVGRREELSRLCAALDETLSGATRLQILTGEAGIGKTRLADELVAYARLRGVETHHGRSYEGRGAPAYWPWVQVLRAYAQAHGRESLVEELGSRAAVIAQIAPSALDGLPPLDPPPALAPDQARFRLFDSIGDLFARAAAKRPLLLVLEDVQWADEPSLLLLEFLARSLRGARLMILASCRTGEPARDDRLSEILTALGRESIGHRMTLRGLPRPEVAELLAALGGREVSDDFVADIHRRTEGNPFFIEEMLRHLVDEGVVEADGRGFVGRARIGPSGVPEGVRAVIGRRLARFDDAVRATLTACAAIGRDFELAVVAEAMGYSQAEMLETLESAVGAALLVRARGDRPDRYSFTHALVRETLYAELGPLQRARLHRRIGEALERLYGTADDRHVAELAHHFAEAMQDGEVAKAIEYATRAAERANRLLAYEEAARFYRGALEAVALQRPVDEARQCRLLLALADTVWSAGQTATAREHYLHAAEVARRTGDARLFAAAAVGLGGRYPGLQINVIDGTLVALLEEAMARLEGTDDPPVPEVMARLAEALTFSPEAGERRMGLARMAVAAARRRNDPVELARVLQHAHLPLWTPDNVEERLAMSTEMEDLARASGDLGVSLAARGWRLVHLMEIGDIDAFRRELADYTATAEELQQPVYRYVAHLRNTMWLLLEGRFDEAEACAMQTLPLGEQAQVGTAMQAFGAQMFGLRMAQGRLAELEPAVASLTETYPDSPAWGIGLALLHVETDQPEKARIQLDRLARNDFTDLLPDLNYNCNLSMLAVVASSLGDAERSARLLPLLLPQAGRCTLASGSAPMGSSSTFLGILATTTGDFDEAERHLREALEMNARIGATPWVAYAQHRYAEMLHARRGPGDRERALDLLGKSDDTARALGMSRLVDRVGALRKTLGADPG